MTVRVTKKPPQYKDGFMLDGPVKPDGIQWVDVLADATIVKGDVVNGDGNGYFTNTLAAFDATFLGIAQAGAAEAASSSGSISVPVLVMTDTDYYWVMNESGTVAAQTDIGEFIDLESNDGVDVTDATLGTTMGFQVLDIDISAEAVAYKVGGFVYGRFVYAVA